MTTVLDDKLPAKALEIINKYGKLVTITVTANTVSVTLGKVTKSSETTYSRKVSPPAPYSSRQIDGTMIQAHDLQCYVAASGLGFTPSLSDEMTVTFDSVVWSVKGFNPLYSGELVAAYKFQLRR